MNNLFENLPEDLRSEVFEKIVEHKGITIERIISKGHSSPDSGWYDQPGHEWVVVLQGEAEIEFEGGASLRLIPGDNLSIAPHQKHRVPWTHPLMETIWLAVHFS